MNEINLNTTVPAIITSDKNDDKSNAAIPSRGKPLPKVPDEFFKELFQFHERRGSPITHMPKITGRVVDLHRLYSEVTERGGFLKVNIRDEWDEIAPVLGFREKCLNATAAIKQIYRRFLDKYERMTYFGEDPDKIEALEASDVLENSRSRSRYPSLHTGSSSGLLNAVPMSYNYRQHIVNMERRRLNKMSTDFYKASAYDKLLLSLLSPLPNEQDFAINACTLMSNESKHTLKLNECPKLLDILLAHTGIFADYTLRKLFQHVYADVRENLLYSFWRDLLYDKPQILELYTDEQILREASLVEGDVDLERVKPVISQQLEEYLADDFFNLKRGEGTQDYVGQRVQQIAAILRNLSFFDENMQVFAKNRTFLRFVVMASNIRWGNIHIQALDMGGNIATELELLDPTTDDLSRSLMATICDGIEGMDRAVILNCLEILYKICQKDSNEDHINKCLNLKFYETICLFLSLNDIMLLIYTLEAIYALTSMGARPCHLIMQVRGIIDQLVALITVEAQSYGPGGCILMRVVETVPGNMLPIVAQNIANLQNVSVKQQQPQTQQPQLNSQMQSHLASMPVLTPSVAPQQSTVAELQPQNQTSNASDTQQIPNLKENIKIIPATATVSQQQQQQQQTQQLPAPQPAPQTTLHMPQNYTHEDEQYAMAWLGATFERATSTESRVEQQELYRMYLAHCQKSGKHSVVNHLQFPRLVRLIYNQSVGPLVVRGSDGLDLPGFHYVGIRIRAQPLPIQGKVTPVISTVAKCENSSPARRIKKKLKPQPIPQPEQSNEATSSSNDSKQEIYSKPTQVMESVELNPTTEPQPPPPPSTLTEQHASAVNIDTSNVISNEEAAITPTTVIADNTQNNAQNPNPPSSSSLIKSLLHTKVTQRQQKQKDLVANPNGGQQTTQVTQPIKVASTAISALVNNPLMQNTPMKVGQTTIKPLSLSQHIEKKPILDSAPPPLAPLSGANVTKDASGRPIIISHNSSNPMLVEIIDKKAHPLDPSQIPANIIKRKIDDDAPPPLTTKRLALDETPVTPSKSAANLYAEIAASILEDEDMEDIAPATSTTTTASLIPTTVTTRPLIEQPSHQPQQQLVRIQQPTTVSVATMQQPQVTFTNTLPRQMIFHQTSTSTLPQLKSTLSGSQQIPTAMATIKTDQGLQTVPVILQQKPMDAQQSPYMMPQATTTQYVLATNPQGQTYLVAQQTPTASPTPTPPPPQQTVLVTQTPQQQSTGTKTIIILQQPLQGSSGASSSAVPTQKMIMTTAQGQQVLVTRPAAATTPTQSQIFINPQTGAATHIQHMPAITTTITNPAFQRQIIQTAVSQSQHQQHQQRNEQAHTGQISPTLLSQLNHIPATIKIVPGQGIPPLQQHQSIIQQHIVSGPSEKRQVILGGGRTIKETIITQGQAQPHQSQLNSQTIITTHQQQQQQQQQISTIVPQKHTAGTMQQIQVSTPTAQKITEAPPLVPTSNIIKSSNVVQTIAPAPQQDNIASWQMVTTPRQQQQQQMPKQQSSQQHQQIKIQTTTHQPVVIAPKPGLTGGGPPPLAAVSNNNTHVVAIKPQLEATTTTATATTTAIEQIRSNTLTTSVSTSASASVISTPVSTITSSNAPNTESKTVIQQQQQTIPSLQQQQQTIITSANTVIATATTTNTTKQILPQQPSLPHPSLPQVVIPPIDPNWLYICDWRNCPRRKYKSLLDLQYHVTTVHCPDHLDPEAQIFCQWGAGPGLCDGVPRKRFCLMTHLVDRHLLPENLRSACQRRIANGTVNVHPTQPPVTIMKTQRDQAASPTHGKVPMGLSALHATKRHMADMMSNTKELADENEGPVTKSIRLTAALILRNLVTYTDTAKRSLRRYETHLANIALSNVESSGALSHILAELND